MKYLLDTHTLYWALFIPRRLDEQTKALLKNGENSFYVSATSFWEIEIKHSKNPSAMERSGKQAFEIASELGFEILPIKPEHTFRVGDFASQGIHSDPFDHLLLATAKEEQLILLTHDATLAKYKGVLVETY